MMVLTPTTTSWIGSPSALRRRFISIRTSSSLTACITSGAIACLHAKFVQLATIEAAESLDDCVSETAIPAGAVGELMASEVIQAVRDEDVLIDMKRRRNALGEPIHDVVVGVSTIIQLGIKTAQPFLSKYRTVSVGRIEQQPFESQLTNAGDSGPDLEGQVCTRFVRVSPFEEADFGIEARSRSATLH